MKVGTKTSSLWTIITPPKMAASGLKRRCRTCPTCSRKLLVGSHTAKRVLTIVIAAPANSTCKCSRPCFMPRLPE